MSSKKVDLEQVAFEKELLRDTSKRCEEIRKKNPPNADFLIYLALEMYELMRA